MKKETQLIILALLGAVGAWLWFTRSGRTIAATAGSAVATGVSYVEKLIRGERNNNPGNIRISANTWFGKIPLAQNTDRVFEQFDTVQNGIRAIGKLLITYFTKYGANTVRAIITRYAPPTENVTSSYVNAVASALGVSPDAQINMRDPLTLFALTRSIIQHENGRVMYADATIKESVNRALT